MLLEAKLQELMTARQAAARIADEEKRVQKIALYFQNGRVLADVVEAVPLLVELGFNTERMAALLELPNPVPSGDEVKAEAVVSDHLIETTLSYIPKSNYASAKVEFTIVANTKYGELRRRGSAPFVTAKIEETVVDTVALILSDIEERERNSKMYERKLERKRQLVPAFVDCARRFVAIWEEYERKQAEWLATEQARIWQPWSAYELWIVPLGHAIDESNGFEKLLVKEHPIDIANQLAQEPMTEVTVIHEEGTVSYEWIAGIVRACAVNFHKPGYAYHRRFPIRDSWDEHEYLYGSPFNGETPTPAPARPDYWRDWLSAHKPETSDQQNHQIYHEVYQDFNSHNPNELVNLTPDTFTG